MTVPIETSRVNYVGNGATTVFTTGFYFLSNSDLLVKLTPSGGIEVVQVLGVHYTVTMPASVGAAGSITMLVAPPAASALVIERDVAFVQDTSFRTQGSFAPAVHEDTFDRLEFQLQELLRRVASLESAGAPGAVVAGSGLFFSGATLHVGAGEGVQVNADDVALSWGPAPADVTKVAAASGTAVTPSRSDHKHNVSTAAPGTIGVGDVAAEGAATSLARSDHLHALTAPAAPANVTKAAAAAGSATTVARSDHKHDVTTAAASELTDSTNSEGSATSLARSDHGHSHGVRGGGTLHAEATTAAAGFESAADKLQLSGLQQQAIQTYQTVDATGISVNAFGDSFFGVLTTDKAVVIEAIVTALKSDSSVGAAWHIVSCWRRTGSVAPVRIGANVVVSYQADGGAAAWTCDVSGTTTGGKIFVSFQGAAATTINWTITTRCNVQP